MDEHEHQPEPATTLVDTKDQPTTKLSFSGVRAVGGARVPLGLDTTNPEHLAAWSKHLDTVRAQQLEQAPQLGPNAITDVSWATPVESPARTVEDKRANPSPRGIKSRLLGLFSFKNR